MTVSGFGDSRAAGPKENDEDVPFGQSRIQVAAKRHALMCSDDSRSRVLGDGQCPDLTTSPVREAWPLPLLCAETEVYCSHQDCNHHRTRRELWHA